MDIKSLRKMSSSDFSKITQAAETITQGGGFKKEDDTRMWKLSPDKAGNASATIRFLPRVEGEELPWVKVIDHGFQGKNGKWYIEKSLATMIDADGQQMKDPVSELNSQLWASGEAGQAQARAQKRRTSHYANILVINDPAKPENNGQVKLYKFGKKIMEKILDKARPTFADEKPVNVFDFWEGADFKLRMKQVEGFPNYDASVFGEPSAISDDDNEIVKIANAQYKLQEFLDPKNFKTYAELKAQLNKVLGEGASVSTVESDDERETKAAPVVGKTVSAPKPAVKASSLDDSVDTDSADYFRSLAEE